MAIPNLIVVRSLSLLRALSKEYGSTKTMEIWEELSGLIDDGDLKMEVFKLMLTGGHAGTHIEVQYWDVNNSNHAGRKVSAIKMLRIWTNCGLKEGKDAIDAAADRIKTSISLNKLYDDNNEEIEIPYEKLMADFKSVGLTIELV